MKVKREIQNNKLNSHIKLIIGIGVFVTLILLALPVIWPPFISSNYIGDSVFIDVIFKNQIPKTFTDLQKQLLIFIGIKKNLFTFLSIFNTLLVFLAAILLSTEFTNNKYIKLLFSIIIVFAPIRLNYSNEWLAHANWSFLLIYIYLLAKFYKTSNYIIPILLGLMSGLAYYNHPYQAVMLGIITIVTFISILIIQRHHISRKNIFLCGKRIFVWVVIALGLFAFVVYLWHLSSLQRGNNAILFNDLVRSDASLWAYSARPWQYVIPDINHPFLGVLAVKAHYWIWQHPPYYLTEVFFPKEHSLFLGFTLIGLAIYSTYIVFCKKAFDKNQRTTIIILLIICISAFILSMPPFISLKGFKLYFPSHYFYPYIPQFRAYARYGVFVYIALASISIMTIDYLVKTYPKKHKIILISITFLILFELLNASVFNRISSTPTPPYLWLTNTLHQNTYLEIPRRADFSDILYLRNDKNIILNPYGNTTKDIALIEDSLWSDNFSKPDSLWCNDFRELNGKYLMFHKKDINKRKVVDEFIESGVVTEELKVAMAESWGYPVWGTHAERPEKDVFREKREEEMEALLRADPKFKVVAEFSQEEIAASRPNKNFSADKFDEVVIFEIDEDYCNSLSQDQE